MLFEQAFALARFYYDFQDTNVLIADAETIAWDNPAGLRKIAISIKASYLDALAARHDGFAGSILNDLDRMEKEEGR